MTTRDPFPLEKFDNDDKFGNKTTTQGLHLFILQHERIATLCDIDYVHNMFCR